jgi:hypothetical protein
MKDPGSSRDSSAPAPLGARHDDSSLFSLESLRRTEEQAKKEKARDDSGLIDLKALAALERDAPKVEMAMTPAIAPPDLFAVSAPLATTARPISVAPAAMPEAKPGRTKLVVAGVGALVVVASLAAFGAMRGGAQAAPPATAAATAPPTPTTTATAAPAEEPKAAAVTPGERPAATADPKPSATAAAAAVAPKTYAGPRAAPKAAAPKDDAPPPKPVEACDLACQMQRAVSKKK